MTDTTTTTEAPPLLTPEEEEIEPTTTDTAAAEANLNHILFLQDTIKAECKSIMDLQSKTQCPMQYFEHQTTLNNLFVQHMELGLKATSLLAAEGLRSAGSSYGDEPATVELTARAGSGSFDECSTVPLLNRTLSLDE